MNEPASSGNEPTAGRTLLDDLEKARAVAREVLQVSGVHSLGRGRRAEAATYGPGDKVTGVVIADGAIEVHVVLEVPRGLPVPDAADRIRRRLIFLSADRRVDIVVEDLHLPENARLPEEARRGLD